LAKRGAIADFSLDVGHCSGSSPSKEYMVAPICR
jgi:hypothetical protein